MNKAVRKYLSEIGRKGGSVSSPAKTNANREKAYKYWLKKRAEKEADKEKWND